MDETLLIIRKKVQTLLKVKLKNDMYDNVI